MTQLPQFEQRGLLQNLVEAELRAEQDRSRLRNTISDPFKRPSFDSDLNPTFVPQESGFLSTYWDRFERGASELGSLGPQRYALYSIPEMIADNTQNTDIPGPYINNNQGFVIEGKEYNPADLSLDEVLNQMPEVDRTLELYGMNRDRLKELRISNGEQFAEFYPDLVQQIRVSEALQSYNEEHPFLAGVAGTSHFVSNIVGDPLFILSLMFTAGSTTAAREGTEQVAKQTVRSMVTAGVRRTIEGPSSALLRKIAIDKTKQTLFSRLLVTGGGAVSGGLYATGADLAAQDYAIRLGLQEPELKFPTASLGLGLAVGGILGEVGYRSATNSPILPIKKLIHRHSESASSLYAMRSVQQEVKAAERLGRPRKLMDDVDDANATDFVSSMFTELYDDSTGKILGDFLAEGDNLANLDMKKLAEYIATLPTPEELLEAITDPRDIFRRSVQTETNTQKWSPPEEWVRPSARRKQDDAKFHQVKEDDLYYPEVGQPFLDGDSSVKVISYEEGDRNQPAPYVIKQVFQGGVKDSEGRVVKQASILVAEAPPERMKELEAETAAAEQSIRDKLTAKSQPKRTKYSRLTDDIENYTAQVEAFKQANNIKDARKAQAVVDRSKATRDQLIDESFALNRTDMGAHIRSVVQDIPLSAERDPEKQVEMLASALNQAIKTRTEKVRARPLGTHTLHKASRKIGGKWNLPKQQIKEDIGADNQVRSLIGYLTGLIDNSGLDSAEVIRDADGVVIKDAMAGIDEMIRGPVHRINREYDKLNRAGISDDVMHMEIGNAVLEGTTVRPEFRPLMKEILDHLKDIGSRAINTGTLKSLQPKFMPVRVAQQYDAAKVKAAWRGVYSNLYLDEFNPSFSNSPVNYRALEKAGFVEKTDEGYISKTDPLTDRPFFEDADGNRTLPKTIADLREDMKAGYESRLVDSVVLDADESLKNFVGKKNEELVDAEFESPVLRTSSIDPTRHRTLLQQIYFDPRIVKSGLVDTNLYHNLRGYTKIVGFNVALDESVSRLTGQPTRYGLLYKTLEAQSSGNAEAREALIRLKKLKERASGRFEMNRDFAVAGTVLSNIGATLVAGTLAPTVGTTEIGAQIARAILPRSQWMDHVRLIGDAVSKVRDKERLIYAGIVNETEQRSSRHWMDFSDHLPSDVANNKAVKGTRWAAQAARKAFLELPATHMAKALAHSQTFAKLHFNRKKISKIREGMEFLKENPENIKGAARKAGNIDYGEFQFMRDYGIFEPDMLDAAEVLLEIDPGALFTDQSMMKAILEIRNPKTREKANELHNRLSLMALDDTKSFVATPGPGDLNVTDSAMKNLIVSMMSFSATFYNNTLTRVGRTPYWKQVGYFTYLVGAELTNTVIREYLYEDKTWEEIQEDWYENYTTKLGQAVSRIPLQGPFAVPSLFGYALASGRPELGFRGFTGGAVPNMVGNSTKALLDVGNSLYSGEPLTDSESNNAQRYIPGWNNWMLRVLEKLPTLVE